MYLYYVVLVLVLVSISIRPNVTFCRQIDVCIYRRAEWWTVCS